MNGRKAEAEWRSTMPQLQQYQLKHGFEKRAWREEGGKQSVYRESIISSFIFQGDSENTDDRRQ